MNTTDKIQVSLDLSFVQVAIDLWRQATDMNVPVHDDFKVHFMTNRGEILRNFDNTATAWSMMLRGMAAKAPKDARALEEARAALLVHSSASPTGGSDSVGLRRYRDDRAKHCCCPDRATT